MQHKIVRELIDPVSIVVVGGSNNIHKPGGKLVLNLREGTFRGELYVLNSGETEVQGVKSFPSVKDMQAVELAVLAVPAKASVEITRELAARGTKAFIVISAGFSEEGEEADR